MNNDEYAAVLNAIADNKQAGEFLRLLAELFERNDVSCAAPCGAVLNVAIAEMGLDTATLNLAEVGRIKPRG